MTTSTFRTAAVSLGAVLLLVLTACSGGGSTGSGGNDPDDLPKGPLDEMFEEMYGGWDEDQGARDMMRVEEIVAECMAEEGFEYLPVDQTQFSYGGEELDVEYGTLEFAEQYGYGATTNPWGGDVEEMEAEQEEFFDPNQELVEAMSQTEQEAYYAALWGNQEYIEGEETEYDWTTAGCQGRAQHEVYEGGVDADEFEALQEEMNTMWDAIQQDPRVAELDGKWASCMADAGHDGFAAIYDAETSIYDRTNEIHESAWEDVELDENASEADWQAIDAQIQAELAEITDDEIELAVADFTCREEINFARVQAEVAVEHQTEFYDAHKEELEAWLASYQEARAD